MCQESEYIENSSKAFVGVAARAPPTIAPKRLRVAIKVNKITSNETLSIGRRVSHLIGDGAWTKSISAFSRASSFRSRAELVTPFSSYFVPLPLTVLASALSSSL